MSKTILAALILILPYYGCGQSQSPDDLSYYRWAGEVVVYIDSDPGPDYVQSTVSRVDDQQAIQAIVTEIRKLDGQWIPASERSRPSARIAAVHSGLYGTIFFTPPKESEKSVYLQTDVGGSRYETTIPRIDYDRLMGLLNNTDLTQNYRDGN